MSHGFAGEVGIVEERHVGVTHQTRFDHGSRPGSVQPGS